MIRLPKKNTQIFPTGMITPTDVDRIKRAITRANSVTDIERLEAALSAGSLEGVRDLIPIEDNPLSELWADTRENPPPSLIDSKTRPHVVPLTRKTPRELIDDEQAKRRFTESAQLMEVVLNEIYPRIPKTQMSQENNRRAAPDHQEGAKKIVCIDIGLALCRNSVAEFENCLVRVVLSDFLTDRTILDADIELPNGSEVVDIRTTSTGLERYQPTTALSLDAVHAKIFQLMSKETVVITPNASRCAGALNLNHSRWISIGNLIAIDPAKKKLAEGRFHIRSVLSLPQLVEGFTGEAIHDRLKHINLRERMVETNLAMIRLVKSVARQKPVSIPILINPPRRPQTMCMAHIPSNWTCEEVKMVVPSALDIDPIEFSYDVQSNDWRGETYIKFFSDRSLNDAFSKLTACTDIFVGWEWSACGKVTEESLRQLGADFGPVVSVRIQDKYLGTRSVLPGKEESRPFGFIALARYQDALAMAKEPRHIVKDEIKFHVKISKMPITAFKRVPLGDGEDSIEAFVM